MIDTFLSIPIMIFFMTSYLKVPFFLCISYSIPLWNKISISQLIFINMSSLLNFLWYFFSLWWGDSIRRSCLSVCLSVCLYVCLYVCHSFLIFQKRGFESTNSILSNTAKLILLDSLLQVFAYHRSHASVLY